MNAGVFDKSQPLVSILCLTMNHEKYVKQSFESVINQTYKNIEIIYLDNNSTDKTFEIADVLFLKSGLPYKKFKREKDYSISANMNFLISQAAGKYLAPQSGDDWWELNNIEEKIRYVENHQEYGLLYSNGWYYYEDTGEKKLAANKNFISGKIFDHIFLNGVLFPVGIIIKAEILQSIGMYDETNPIDDYDLWLRIAAKYEIGYFSTPLVYYRKHSASITGQSGYINIPYYLKIVEKYKSNRLYKKVTRNLRKFVIYESLIKNEKLTTLQLLIKDFRFERFYMSILLKLIIGQKK